MSETQKVIDALQANWVWVPGWQDSASDGSAARLVTFTRRFTLASTPSSPVIVHCTADTRYKLLINGRRVTVGPTRSSPAIWYYDTIDIAPWLRAGENEIVFLVIRYFANSRGGMPFARTSFPGLTVVGQIETSQEVINIESTSGWDAQVQQHVAYPTGLVDDVFLHASAQQIINERVSPPPTTESVEPVAYGFKTLNGELAPWRLRPRLIPLPEQTSVVIQVDKSSGSVHGASWQELLQGGGSVQLNEGSQHSLDLQAEVHSTAFVRWVLCSDRPARVTLKVTYSEGYELEPRLYPWLRTKEDRLDDKNGRLIGPYDEIVLDVQPGKDTMYEPFWFRTFRLLRMEVSAHGAPVQLVSFTATQTNYPLAVKAAWKEPGDAHSERIWEVCIRTMRNCMFDGYSDCPFYEQLQYTGDSRSVGLFHYMLSGDDRLMRQAITGFAASVTTEGLTQSRYPSQVPQIIVGFALYWVLSICDHHLYFGDTAFVRPLLPLVDGVLEFYHTHIDELGLVSGFPTDVWQYVDWVDTWGATAEHPDKGVPTSGRETNRHTFFSMLYAYVLRKAATLLRDTSRPGHAAEYEDRAYATVRAIRQHCFDGRFFTDSTADVAVADPPSISQHCQVFAVLSGAAQPDTVANLLLDAFSTPMSKCSYVMMFYAFRAFAQAGPEVYDRLFHQAWEPWRAMLAKNMTTWEEDDVRQRSDCHAWGSVPVYEYCTEVAGIQPLKPGFETVLFAPRPGLSEGIECTVALGKDNLATVSWKQVRPGVKSVKLQLSKPAKVVSRLPGGSEVEHGEVQVLELEHSATGVKLK